MKTRVYTAAVCAAFSLNAFAQGALDPVRTAAGMAAIERAQSTGFLAGLERAVKTPLEIVWLRASAEATLWNDPALSRASAVGRTAWRYVFGGNAQFAPRPNEVARLVVSTLNLPQGPVNAGRLDLTGTGRLYLVTPETPNATPPERLAMILAAGSTLHISDATSPSIHIELKAPANRPLLLGNLAAADIGKVLSLLVRPGSANAFEASVAADGKVALRAGNEVQLAALLPDPGARDLPLQIALSPKTATDDVLIASLSPAVSSWPALAAGQSRAVSLPQIARDFASLAVPLESALKGPGVDPLFVASLAPSGNIPVGVRPSRAAANEVATLLQVDMGELAAVIDTGLGEAAKRPSDIEPVILASLAPAIETRTHPLRANAQPARSEAKMDFVAELSVVASAAEPSALPVARTQIAALAPAAGALEFKASPGTRSVAAQPKPHASPDLARMRADIEAEIARERERLAVQFKPQVIGAPAVKRFVLGV